jgi:hypothetical protein
VTDQTSHDLRSERAKYSYDAVTLWADRLREETTRRVKGLPIEIRIQGLMVTLATLISDGKETSRHLSDLLARWLLAEAPYRTLTGAAPERQPSSGLLLEICSKASRGQYAAAQREAVLLFEQIKIFADALANKD